MYVSDTHLRSFLADAGLVSRRDFDAAMAQAQASGTPVGEVLVSKSVVDEDELRRTYAHLLGIPFVSLVGMKIVFETLSLIPEPVARSSNVVALTRRGDEVEVAMLDTDDLSAVEFLKKKHLKVLPRITDAASIKEALKQYRLGLKENLGDLIERHVQSLSAQADAGSAAADVQIASALGLVDALLRHATSQGASDMHLEPLEDSLLVRYRIDGILYDAMQLPKHIARSISARIKQLAALSHEEGSLAQEGRFAAEAAGERVSIRVSIMPTQLGEKIVMRLVRSRSSGFTLESIGLHGRALERVHEAMRRRSGLVLVSGPAGSGVSTTLYTLLDIVNAPEVSVSTIEKQVEYRMPRINQTEVRPEFGFGFGNGLRALLRQDPDVVMVGELKDKETAALAVHAALSGRLVLAGVPAASAAEAITNIVGMGVEPFFLASALGLSVGQRLVRRLGGNKREHELSGEERAQLAQLVDAGALLRALKEERAIPSDTTWKNLPFSLPGDVGADTPFSEEQIGLFEVLPVTASLKEMITAGADSNAIEAQARSEGMLTLMEDGIGKAALGQATIEDVLDVLEN